jgi:hypothetical protein
MNLPSGFTQRTNKDGSVCIFHGGRLAATLRSAEARDFVEEWEAEDELGRQNLMARLTGNYKRGNERLAKSHPRNQD